MKCVVFLLAVAQLFPQTKAYTYCSYRYYNSYSHMYETRHYRCSSSQYCCGTTSCCTMVYARWYLWFVLITFFFVMFMIWWYYRYRYRPRQTAVIAARPVPVVTATTVTCQSATAGQPVQPYPYPYPASAPGYGYPGPGTVNMYQAGNAPQFQAYNKQGGPPQGYAPPPSYSAATAGSGPAYPPQ